MGIDIGDLECTRLTDGQTDRPVSRRYSALAFHAARKKNWLCLTYQTTFITTFSWSTCPSFISIVPSQSKMPQQGPSSTWDVATTSLTRSSVSIGSACRSELHWRLRCWRTVHCIILGVVIHTCRRHSAPTRGQVHLHWTAWRSNLPSVNSRRSCFSCCWCKGVERSAKRYDISFVAGGVQEQAQDVLVPPMIRNCLNLFDSFFSQ